MFTINDLSEGKCAVINDGTLEELQKVVKLAFPEDRSTPMGTSRYYYTTDGKLWSSISYRLNIAMQSVKDFLQPQFKRGEMVLVRDSDSHEWKERIYLTTISELFYPYVCVEGGYEKQYREGNATSTTCWKYIKKIEKEEEKIVELTLKDISEKTGIPIHLIRIKD